MDKGDFWGNTPVDLARSLGSDHLSGRLLSFLLAHSATGQGQQQEVEQEAVGSSGITTVTDEVGGSETATVSDAAGRSRTATVSSRESFFASTRSASPDDSKVVYYGF